MIRADPADPVADAPDWMRLGARAGYLTKGLVYSLIALLAARAAWLGGSAAGPRAVMWAVVEGPVGVMLLSVLTVGLAAYAVWRVIQCVGDTERLGQDLKGLFIRVGYLGSGLVYAGLVVAAVRILMGVARRRQHPDDAYVRGWTEMLMHSLKGRSIAAAVGVGVVVFGMVQLRKMWTGLLTDEGNLTDMSWRRHRRAVWFGRVGAAARGAVFIVMGVWLIVAARNADSDAARGLGGSLDTLARQPYGTWLLAGVAMGLLAYALYQFTLAGYVPPPRREARQPTSST